MKLKNPIGVCCICIFLTSCSSGSSSSGGGSSSSTSSSSSSSSSSGFPSIDHEQNVAKYYRENFRNQYGNWNWGDENSIELEFSGFIINGLNYYRSDGTFGSAWDLKSRYGINTALHLGSIEFYPVSNSIHLSIFHMLRNHNHRSNEVINLTRLLMLLDRNGSQSNTIRLTDNDHQQVRSANLTLSDLLVDIDEFANLDKVSTLLENLKVDELPSVDAAESYLWTHFSPWLQDGWSQWPGGFEIDFDLDGVLNENDAFPWDATQWRDQDQNREGDDPKVEELFLDTNGVLEFAVDTVNGFLYAASFTKTLLKFNLSNGDLLSEIKFDDYITSITLNEVSGDVYVGLSEEYKSAKYVNGDEQQGYIALVSALSGEIEKQIEINGYPVDIELHQTHLFISTKNLDLFEARLMKVNDHLDGPIETLLYSGKGEKIFVGENKLVTYDYAEYNVINPHDDFNFLVKGRLDGFFDDPLFILNEADALVSRYGRGFPLSLLDPQENTSINDSGTQYIETGYYDIRGIAAGTHIGDIYYDESSNQYLANAHNRLIYINADTLIPHQEFRFNDYVSTINGALNYIVDTVAVYEDKVYMITRRRNGTTVVSVVDKPCFECGVNEFPRAEMYSPTANLTVQNEIYLDASPSWGSEVAGNLAYRWDFDSDGRWDTEFLEESHYSVKFESKGDKQVTLQVLDSLGRTDETQIELSLEYGLNSGFEPQYISLENFDIVIQDAEFDSQRNRIYITSPETGELLVIDSRSGEVVRQFSFRYLPTFMAISEDNDTLYLGLTATGCDGATFFACELDLIGQNDGIVLKFDLATQTFIDSFNVDVAPADMAIYGGRLFISSHWWFEPFAEFDPEFQPQEDGSDPEQGGIFVYELDSTEKVEHLNMGTGGNSRFANILYISDTPISNSNRPLGNNGIEIFDGSVASVAFENVDYFPRNWLIPSTSLAVSNAGNLTDVVTLDASGSVETQAGEPVSGLSVDQDNGILYLSSNGAYPEGGGHISAYDLENFHLLSVTSTEYRPTWLFSDDENIIVIERLGNTQYRFNQYEKY